MKKNKSISKNIMILVVLIMILMVVFGYRILTRFILSTSSSGGIKGIVCELKGYKWFGNYPGPTGCFKQYSDGGKECTSGSDCTAMTCVVRGITLNVQNKPMSNLTGECPSFGPESDDYFLTCGYAKIENGDVVEDMRGCVY